MTQVIGILNVTPDSFSDGGQFANVVDAIARGLELHAQGADLVDVGGESTRPGADRVPVEDEQSRVIPVVTALVAAGVPVSVDTMNSGTALASAKAGASVINDVSGGLADPEMYRVVAQAKVGYIAMHWRGTSAGGGGDGAQPWAHTSDPAALATYGDVVDDVRNELKARVAEMLVWGIDPGSIILDPGLGFAKTAEHNWQLLSRLDEITSLGYPVLVGASRKRFLKPFGDEPVERDHATAIVSALAARAGAWGVRVHDVPSTKDALAIADAFETGVLA